MYLVQLALLFVHHHLDLLVQVIPDVSYLCAVKGRRASIHASVEALTDFKKSALLLFKRF